jgi:hypothetical protein
LPRSTPSGGAKERHKLDFFKKPCYAPKRQALRAPPPHGTDVIFSAEGQPKQLPGGFFCVFLLLSLVAFCPAAHTERQTSRAPITHGTDVIFSAEGQPKQLPGGFSCVFLLLSLVALLPARTLCFYPVCPGCFALLLPAVGHWMSVRRRIAARRSPPGRRIAARRRIAVRRRTAVRRRSTPGRRIAVRRRTAAWRRIDALDAGSPFDAGPPFDAVRRLDAESPFDAGPPLDAGLTPWTPFWTMERGDGDAFWRRELERRESLLQFFCSMFLLTFKIFTR